MSDSDVNESAHLSNLSQTKPINNAVLPWLAQRTRLLYLSLASAVVACIAMLLSMFSLLDEHIDFESVQETQAFTWAFDIAAYLRGDSSQAQTLKWAHTGQAFLDESKPLSKQQQNLVVYFHKKYRVASSEMRKIVAFAYIAGNQTKIDPLLILSVAAVESNMNPILESYVGALGLMQIMPKVHAQRFAPYGGVSNIFRLDANIHVGARILQDCLKMNDLQEEKALQCYVGAPNSTEYVYAQKVLTEKQRLTQIMAGDLDWGNNNKDLDLKSETELNKLPQE